VAERGALRVDLESAKERLLALGACLQSQDPEDLVPQGQEDVDAMPGEKLFTVDSGCW
jgi:hypothetical protein